MNRTASRTRGVDARVARPGTNRPQEVTCCMLESDARRTLAAPQPLASTSGFEEEEPPSRPRRHPAWEDVPDAQWDDWRWQTQNSIRSIRQLRNLLEFSPEELEAIGRLEGDY